MLTGKESCLVDLSIGAVQGSIFGQILYAIFISPLLRFIKANKKVKYILLGLKLPLNVHRNYFRQ
jgi:hypothetical protein